MQSLKDKKIVIVGLGLIGGSVARALVKLNLECEIIAVGRNEKVLQQAIEDGNITGYATDIEIGCSDADIIILAVPVLSLGQQLSALKGVISDRTIITDVASVKQAVVDAAAQVFGTVPVNFVPAHPIAGSEKSGYLASTPDLFVGRNVILTPLEHTSKSAVCVVQELWEAIGADVLEMTVTRHDEVLAATSHLPHLLAFALVDTLLKQDESEEIFRYAAGGFRDFTRIASSDPVMWRDIFLTNGKATIAILDKYVEDLQTLRSAVEKGEVEVLFDTFTRAKQSRDKFLVQLEQSKAKK